jgi:mono/diheme cytochrome c family protein
MRMYAGGLAALLLLQAACAEKNSETPARQFNPGPVPSELVAGETLFNQNCGGCHGNLAMGTTLGPPLVHIIYEPSHHSDEAFRRAASLGVVPHHWSFGPMPRITTVTPDQIDQIIAYVRWLQEKAGIT